MDLLNKNFFAGPKPIYSLKLSFRFKIILCPYSFLLIRLFPDLCLVTSVFCVCLFLKITRRTTGVKRNHFITRVLIISISLNFQYLNLGLKYIYIPIYLSLHLPFFILLSLYWFIFVLFYCFISLMLYLFIVLSLYSNIFEFKYLWIPISLYFNISVFQYI